MTRTYAWDLIERAGWTFLQALLGVFAVAQYPHGEAEWKSLALAGVGAGIAAVVSLVKGVVAGVKLGTASTSRTVAEAQLTSDGAHVVTTLPITLNSDADAVPPPDAADVLARANAIHPAAS